MPLTLSSETYVSWLKDRGLNDASAASAAGAFLSNLDTDASTLLVASCEESEVKASDLAVMLQKLAAAIGGRSSVVLCSQDTCASLRALLSMHQNLVRVVLLGQSWQEAAELSGCRKHYAHLDWITGPEALEVLTNTDIKRAFWNDLKQRLL